MSLLKKTAEVPGRTAKSALHPVPETGVSTIEDLVEEIINELNHVLRQLSSFESFDKVLPGNIHHRQFTTGHLVKDGRDLPEGQEFRSGQLVDLTVMSLFCQSGRNHIGDIIGIEITFPDMSIRDGKGSTHEEVAEKGLGKILVKPATANDGGGDSGVENESLAELGFFLATTGEKDDLLDLLLLGDREESANVIGSTRDGEVGMIGKVERLDAGKHLVPIGVIVPIEAQFAGARCASGPMSELLKTLDDPASCFSTASDHEEGSIGEIGLRGGLGKLCCFHRRQIDRIRSP